MTGSEALSGRLDEPTVLRFDGGAEVESGVDDLSAEVRGRCRVLEIWAQ